MLFSKEKFPASESLEMTGFLKGLFSVLTQIPLVFYE